MNPDQSVAAMYAELESRIDRLRVEYKQVRGIMSDPDFDAALTAACQERLIDIYVKIGDLQDTLPCRSLAEQFGWEFHEACRRKWPVNSKTRVVRTPHTIISYLLPRDVELSASLRETPSPQEYHCLALQQVEKRHAGFEPQGNTLYIQA